jgi:hypothetical protein
MYQNDYQKYVEYLKKVLYKLRPRFSFHYVAYTTLIFLVIFSVIRLVSAAVPNPGHPWTDIGDGGVFTFYSGQNSVNYTYTLPAANTTVLTTNAAVTVGQGGTGLTTVADGSILAANTADTLSAVTWHSSGTKVLTNTSGTISWENPTGGISSVAWADITGTQSDISLSGFTNDLGIGTSPITIVNSTNLFSTGLTGTGSGVTATDYSNFFGTNAGYQATDASSSNFFGATSGYNATYAAYSNFYGTQAGSGATNSDSSNYFGYQAGQDATDAYQSNFYGISAGRNATNARNSNLIGAYAGYGATNASNAIMIGTQAGYSDTVNNTASDNNWSILLGYNTKTGGYSNSVLIGGATSTTAIANTKANQFMLAPSLTELRLRGVDYTLPSAQGGVGTVLTNNGSGVLTWASGEPSDINLKKNVTDFNNAEFILETVPDMAGESTLDKIMNITSVTYNWNTESDTDQKHVGFIAQELEQIFPLIVNTDSSTGLKSVSYAKITPYLVKAMQEMNLKIEDLSSLDLANTNSLGSIIKRFLEDVQNGIDVVFFGEVRTKKLCIEDTCVDKTQLEELLNNAKGTNTSETTKTEVPVAEENTSETATITESQPETQAEQGTTDTSTEGTTTEITPPENSTKTETSETPYNTIVDIGNNTP